MKSRERVLCALAGSVPDRVPVGPFLGVAAAAATGVSLRRYYTDGDSIGTAQYELWKKVGHDILVTAADTYYIAEAFGLRTRHHENALPTVEQPLIRDLEKIDEIRVPDPRREGRMPVYLQALRRAKQLSAGRLALRGTGTGPFSLAAYLLGEERFLMLLAEIGLGETSSRDILHINRLLDMMAETTIAFLKAQVEIGLDILYMGDSFASADMISPAMYRTWVLPRHRMVFDALRDKCRSAGTVMMLHICGRNDAVLADFESAGADLIEIDHKMDLATARKILGPATSIIGNLDPVKMLLQGDPEAIMIASRKAISAAHGKAGKFILGTGCFVPAGTPIRNLEAMVAASKLYDTNLAKQEKE